MTKYEKGAGFERKIATILRRKGYFVTRSAGSFSIADLTAEKSGAIAITACKEDYKPIVFTRLTGFSVHQGGKGMVIRESSF